MRSVVFLFLVSACGAGARAATTRAVENPGDASAPADDATTGGVNVTPTDASQSAVDASSPDAAEAAAEAGPPTFDRRKQRTRSDDACVRDADCVVTHFFDCCQPCEGHAPLPANKKLLAKRMAACAAHACPPSRNTYECAPAPSLDEFHAFCVEHVCVAQ